MSVLTGGRTIWAYVWEDDGEYAQEPGAPSDSEFKAFGNDEDVSEPDADNSTETYYRPFDRQPSEYHEMEYEGTWGTDFIYTNPWWLAFVYGEPQITDNTDSGGDYVLSYNLSPTNPPKTAHLVEENHYQDGTVTQTVYTGAGVDDPSFSTAVQDPLDVSINGFYADQRTFEDATQSPYGKIGDQPDTDFSPLNFANTELYLDLTDSGTAEFRGAVQDVDVSFNANIEPDYELGTRFATSKVDLDFEPDLTYSARVTNEIKEAERTNFYGNQVDTGTDAVFPAEEMSDVDVKGRVDLFSRKETNSLSVSWNEAFPTSFSRANFGDPASAIDDDVDRSLLDVTAEATVGVDPSAYFA